MDTTGELLILRELYASLTLHKNFFQPTMKLQEKVRVEGKIHRKYDEPKTPYQRLLQSDQLPAAACKRLKAQYESLNLAELRRRVEASRKRLFDCIEKRNPAEPAAPRRRGPGIRFGGVAHALWMRKMLGGNP